MERQCCSTSEPTAEGAALYVFIVFMKGVSWRGGMTVPGVGGDLWVRPTAETEVSSWLKEEK